MDDALAFPLPAFPGPRFPPLFRASALLDYGVALRWSVAVSDCRLPIPCLPGVSSCTDQQLPAGSVVHGQERFWEEFAGEYDACWEISHRRATQGVHNTAFFLVLDRDLELLDLDVDADVDRLVGVVVVVDITRTYWHNLGQPSARLQGGLQHFRNPRWTCIISRSCVLSLVNETTYPRYAYSWSRV